MQKKTTQNPSKTQTAKTENTPQKTVKSFPGFRWIDLENPDHEALKKVTHDFQLDLNLVKDSLQHGHLPKMEKGNNYNFILLRAFSTTPGNGGNTVGGLTNKIAFFLNEKELLTIHRYGFDFLKNNYDGHEDPESLMLEIINDMLHTYEQPLLEQSERMDAFEKEIFLRNATSISLKSLYYQKSKARIFKKVFHLTQNVLNQLKVKQGLESDLQDVKETTLSYLLQFDEIIEDANTVHAAYLTVAAQKSNSVMKLLTVFSAFFLPLSFIAGIYGMNFENMPELQWEFGYFYALAIMAVVAAIVYFWFRRKKIL